jgi:hypothetical protein
VRCYHVVARATGADSTSVALGVFLVILICDGDPRKDVGSVVVFGLFCLVPGSVCLGGGPQLGSWWSARSAARTNDLEADEDPPQTWPAGMR